MGHSQSTTIIVIDNVIFTVIVSTVIVIVIATGIVVNITIVVADAGSC